jgi:hypothetical protein
MKTEDNQSLKNLFREIRIETPSPGFTQKMTFRIEQEIRKKERQQQWISILQIAAGMLGIIAVASGALYWKIGFVLSFPKLNLSVDPLIWIIGLAILLVLIGDSLLRKWWHS